MSYNYSNNATSGEELLAPTVDPIPSLAYLPDWIIPTVIVGVSVLMVFSTVIVVVLSERKLLSRGGDLESVGQTAAAAVSAAAAAPEESPTSQVAGGPSLDESSRPRAPAPSKPSAMTPSVLGERVGNLSAGGRGQAKSSKAPKGRGRSRDGEEKDKDKDKEKPGNGEMEKEKDKDKDKEKQGKKGKEGRGEKERVGGVKDEGNNGLSASSVMRDSLGPTVVEAPLAQEGLVAAGRALPRVEDELAAGDGLLVVQGQLAAGDALSGIGDELGAGDAACGVLDNLAEGDSSSRKDGTRSSLNTSAEKSVMSDDGARKGQGGGDVEGREGDDAEAKSCDGDGHARKSGTSTGAGAVTDGENQTVEGRHGGVDDDVAHRSKTATRSVRLVPITAVEAASSMVKTRSLFGPRDGVCESRSASEGRREWGEAGEDDDGGGDDGQRGKKGRMVGVRLCEEEVDGGGVQGRARGGDDGGRGKRGGRIAVKLDGERPWQQGNDIKGIRADGGDDESMEGRKKRKKKKRKEGRKGDLDMIPSSKKGD